MRLTYETATATLIQFIVLGMLNIANGINSTVTECRADSRDCVGSILLAMIYFLLITGWFGFLVVLGYAAQERRSKRLALALIAAEGMVALVSFFNARHHNSSDFLGLVTSIIDLLIALWVITLAFRLMRAKGGRVVAHQRSRARRRPVPRP